MQRRRKLIFWRFDRRLRQCDIADKLGVTVSHYSNLERGMTNPSYEVLMKFRKIFKIEDVLELFEKGEEESHGYCDKSRDFREE